MADIKVEEFVSESRQKELFAMAGNGRRATAIRTAIREAIQAERERCARVVEKGLGKTNTAIARGIRDGVDEEHS